MLAAPPVELATRDLGVRTPRRSGAASAGTSTPDAERMRSRPGAHRPGESATPDRRSGKTDAAAMRGAAASKTRRGITGHLFKRPIKEDVTL